MDQSNALQLVPGRFSVVVPSFQQGQFLERTLLSLFAQNDPDLEIIVQDGGSTDGSIAILQRYAARLRWESRPDGGQTAAINTGLRKATGEFLCYLNSDDVLCDGALKRVRDFFMSSLDARVVYGRADFINEHDEMLGDYPVEPWNYQRLKETCFICQPACFWRREVWDQYGPFDETLHYAMDYEYWLRIGLTTPFHFLPEKLAGSRCHARAKAFDQTSAVLSTTISVLQRYHNGQIPPQWIVAYARDRAERQLQKGGVMPIRWTRFALTYWGHMQALAPKVTAGGAKMLRQKIAPPYPSARRRTKDQLGYFNRELAGKM